MASAHVQQDSDFDGDTTRRGPGLLARLLGWWQARRRAPAKPAKARRKARPEAQARESDSFAPTQLTTLMPEGPATDPAQRQLWKDARHALTEVLNRHGAARRVFRHLGALEHAISKHGPKALRQLPIEVLEQALVQMESLVTDWSGAGLAFLRSTLSVEVKERLKLREDKENALSVFVAPNKLQVDEDSESAFMEFQRHWAAANASAEVAPANRPRRAA